MRILKKIRNRAHSLINEKKRLIDNRLIAKNLYKKDPRVDELKVSKKVHGWLNDLKKNGIVKICNEFEWVEDVYNKEYLEKKNKYFISENIDERAKITGRVFSKTLSPSDPKLEDWYFNEDLFILISKIFKQQPYYRNLPSLQIYKFTPDNREDIAGKWHIDSNLHQITFMLLLNDLKQTDTHMKYAIGSNNHTSKKLDRDRINPEEIENNFDIMDCVGKAGTLFIFCGGTGYHKALYKPHTKRKIYHANFTPGHDIIPEFLTDNNILKKLNKKKFPITNICDALIKENHLSDKFYIKKY